MPHRPKSGRDIRTDAESSLIPPRARRHHCRRRTLTKADRPTASQSSIREPANFVREWRIRCVSVAVPRHRLTASHGRIYHGASPVSGYLAEERSPFARFLPRA